MPIARALRALTLLLLLAVPLVAGGHSVQITQKPRGLVWGTLSVPVAAGESVEQIELRVNGVPFATASGRNVTFNVAIGKYIRRLRVRAIGLDSTGRVVGQDEMTVNDPQPPFRVRLELPKALPEEGSVTMFASVLAPRNIPILGIDFYVEETLIGTDLTDPYSISFDAAENSEARYARAVARARGSLEANSVAFWGDAVHEDIEVVVKHIPLSVFGKDRGNLTRDDITLIDSGHEREIDSLVPAQDQPLNVIMLVDTSESMLNELPVIQQAAREFARSIVRQNDRIAVVAFHQRVFWLTGFTSDLTLVDKAIGKLEPRGQTHLYDAVIQMLYELQKMPGRKALVVLSDGMNFGGEFELDHLVHYARYSGVPIYPIVKNRWLSRFMRFGLGLMEARRFAEIARESGASYFVISDPSELPAVYRSIASELQQQYIVVFRTESTGADIWHPLAVQSSRKLNLRVPRGYFP
ncbi:MAG: VWA domain-containing protein [Thermoanaerobaculia bacterium]